jgi:hypothetical protein
MARKEEKMTDTPIYDKLIQERDTSVLHRAEEMWESFIDSLPLFEDSDLPFTQAEWAPAQASLLRGLASSLLNNVRTNYEQCQKPDLNPFIASQAMGMTILEFLRETTVAEEE